MGSLSGWAREQAVVAVEEARHLDQGQRRTEMGRVFAEEPVDLTTFVQDSTYLNNPPLSEIQYEAVRAIEQVLFMETYAAMALEFGDYWSPVEMVNFITLQWGKGSGKDHICRMAVLRVCYILGCMHDALGYFDKPAQDTIHILNVASSSHQAQQAFFLPMVRAVKRGWFEDKVEPKMNSLSWHNNVECISGHSDSESQEGLNILVGIADEIDAFKTKEELERFRGRGVREPVKSAEAVIKMMRGSSVTRFPQTFKNVYISYPRFLGSTIQRLTREHRQEKENDEAQGRTSRHYVSGPFPTWEVNPNVKGKEDFAADYRENPEQAQAMFECKPSVASENLYFSNHEALGACFVKVKNGRQPVEPVYRFVQGNWEVEWSFRDDLIPVEGARYAMHGDIAIRQDRAGIAMSHVKNWVQGELLTENSDGTHLQIPTSMPVVVNDFTFSFEADRDALPAPREVQVRWYRQLLWELQRRGFRVVRYTFDSFQSVDSQQIIERSGVETDTVSMDRNDLPWKALRDVMYDGRLQAPWRSRLWKELVELGLTPQGKVDHPPTGSKDEADAFCGSVVGALHIGGTEQEDGARAWPGDSNPEGGEDFHVGFITDDWGYEPISITDDASFFGADGNMTWT